MSSDKKTMTILLVVAIILFAIAVGIWWHLFFGTPNPPLPRANVSVATSSASTAPAIATSTAANAAVSSTEIAAAGAATNSAENPPLPEEELIVDGTTFNVEVASTMLEQSRGLSFRTSLGNTDGMLFVFASGTIQTFWMKDMNFALDMVWISGNTVVGFSQNVPAPAAGAQIWQLPIYASPGNTDKVLEVNAGTVAQYKIKVGDTIAIQPVPSGQ